MLAILSLIQPFLPLVVKIIPVLIAWYYSDKVQRKNALDKFNAWVEAHKDDAVLSSTLHQSEVDQKADLAAQAAAREKADVAKETTEAAIKQVTDEPPEKV